MVQAAVGEKPKFAAEPKYGMLGRARQTPASQIRKLKTLKTDLQHCLRSACASKSEGDQIAGL
jgi:hypothetical protein